MMTRGRLAIVYALLAVLIGGHLFDNAMAKEHWPFSNYPMFANAAGDHLDTYQFTCLYADATGATREVYLDPAWVPSLPQYKVMAPHAPLRRDLESGHPDPAHVRRLMADYLSAYDACRRAGLNHGPDVRAVRLYRVAIPLEVPARRVELGPGYADYARLVAEVDRPSAPVAVTAAAAAAPVAR